MIETKSFAEVQFFFLHKVGIRILITHSYAKSECNISP